jgi:Flp pilus assembly CpaF family ATPase
MRPDRIVVGEVRGAEAFELTRAVNAGCGFLCTIHANRASDAVPALVNAALMAGENVTESIVQRVFGDALDVVVHVDRAGTRRQVTEIAAVGRNGTIEPIFTRDRLDAPLAWTGALPDTLESRTAARQALAAMPV